MTQETIELTRAVNRLADGLEKVINRLDLIAEAVKEGKEKNPPCTPLKEKDQENNNNNNFTRARAREGFVKPTVEEVAAHVKARGYTFDAEQFWSYYESNGWYVGRRKMKSWQSACVTWQKRNGNGPRPLTAYERKRVEFELEAEAIAARKEASRRAAIAALTAKDWALCAERCANCRASGGCLAGVAVPPDHRLNARRCSPEECPRFAAKDQLAPTDATGGRTRRSASLPQVLRGDEAGGPRSGAAVRVPPMACDAKEGGAA